MSSVSLAGRVGSLIAVAALMVLTVDPTAEAAFPGANGRIAFASSEPCGADFCNAIVTANPDGTARTLVFTAPPETIVDNPAWSADGTRLLTGGWDGVAREWDTATLTLLRALPAGAPATERAVQVLTDRPRGEERRVGTEGA